MSRTDVRSRIFEFIAITLAILWIADRAWLRTNLKTLATELTDADEQIARLNSTVRELQIAPINRQKLHELQEAGAETEIGVVGISFIHPPALSTTSMTLKDLPNVTSLTIRSPGMTSSILQPVDEMTSLKYCFLTGDCLIDADEEVCAILSKLPSLQSVELAHASFSMDVYHHIAQHPGLRLVSLNES
ncbi:MAG: hypothetical protein KDA85_10275, partial [Planctomycetaceae bacterium]|nr:hypothetical protein [Planctomycetaceae bacterium]